MIHWLATSIGTYILHPLSGRGYQWWSGVGSDLTYVGVLVGLWRHVNCEQPWCWRPGHRHPGHGRPTCCRHYHNDLEPKGVAQ